MRKILYHSKDKGVMWIADFRKTCVEGYETTSVYILPTITYFRFPEFEFDDDHEFNIYFGWLIFELVISRHWGTPYKD